MVGSDEMAVSRFVATPAGVLRRVASIDNKSTRRRVLTHLGCPPVLTERQLMDDPGAGVASQ